MCGRFTLRTRAADLVKFFDLEGSIADLSSRWNVAPTQQVLAIRSGHDSREPSWLRWGLVPAWAKDMKMGSSLINARADTVAEKPSFRSAFKRRRCLVVADGFYEWQAQGKAKVPFMVTMRDGSPFAFAGLWEQWNGPSGGPIESCSTITTDPNELMATIHDRMPVILQPDDYDSWLDPANQDIEELMSFLVPYPSDEMKVEEVSTVINNARNEEDPRLTKNDGYEYFASFHRN